MAEHTPGPWTIRQHTSLPHEYIVSGRRDGKGETVCRVSDGGFDLKVANLCLIAASPDLLAALQGVMFSLEEDLAIPDQDVVDDWSQRVRACRAAVDLAIGHAWPRSAGAGATPKEGGSP